MLELLRHGCVTANLGPNPSAHSLLVPNRCAGTRASHIQVCVSAVPRPAVLHSNYPQGGGLTRAVWEASPLSMQITFRNVAAKVGERRTPNM